jgi:hypothetical protein
MGSLGVSSLGLEIGCCDRGFSQSRYTKRENNDDNSIELFIIYVST